MFFQVIKIFFLKVNVKKSRISLEAVQTVALQNIGILIDVNNTGFTEQLVNNLVQSGVNPNNIHLIKFINTKNKIQDSDKSYVSYQDYSLFGQLKNPVITQFINTPFDLLINYYDNKIWPLACISRKSKSKFKIGFANAFKTHQHLSIDCRVQDVDIFVTEILKYIHIINNK